MIAQDNRSRGTVGVRRRGPGALLTRWVSDLALGVRLAVGGGRTSWVRLALTAMGVGLGVMVLLAATSVPHMLQARADRGSARAVPRAEDNGAPQAVAGVDPVSVGARNDEFMSRGLQGYVVELSGPAAPHAPGVSRLPAPGEVVLSPALAELLKSQDGELLRPRFTQRVIGTIGEEGLTGPNELFFYVGADDVSAQRDSVTVSQFGYTEAGRQLTGLEWLLVILGSATFLIPVVVFVATSTRLAASARDRRLAALRLVGADGKQVRRIAAGEAFVGALAGLLVGVAMFLVARSLVPDISLSAFRGGIFSEDIRPEWTLVALIVVAVPLLAVGVAVLSLRRTIIEPLGVVRRGRQGRRKLWWRLLPIVAGIGLLATQTDKFTGHGGNPGNTPVIAGIVLLLIAVPVVLPWVVERVVWWFYGGSPAWQLAVRRLQLDSGTSARVVGGVAVVLTGAIALQTLFIPAQSQYDRKGGVPATVSVSLSGSSLAKADIFTKLVREVPGVDNAKVTVSGQVRDVRDNYLSMTVGSCQELQKSGKIGRCADGDVFFVKPVRTQPPTQDERSFDPVVGQSVWFDSVSSIKPNAPQWTIPANLGQVDAAADKASNYGTLLATPGALANAKNPALYASAALHPKVDDPRFVEYVRNAMVPLGWTASVFKESTGPDQLYLLISRVLNIGSVITLLLAAASLMVVALEQIRERRRALAVLMANGVQRKVLARSLLWQTAIPIVLAVVIAVACGLGLAALLLTVSGQPVTFDWPTVAVFSGTGLAAVLLVTGLTLPSLWRAASAEGLRGE